MGITACCTYITLAIAAVSALLAYYNWNIETFVEFSKTFDSIPINTPPETKVANSWKEIIQYPQKHHRFDRIAVGVNGNVDIILKGSKLLSLIDPSSNSSGRPSDDHESLKNIDDLKATFAYHHSKGAGGERYMESKEDFRKILEAATKVQDAEYYIGGNAALMAQKLATIIHDDGEVTVGVPVGPKLKPLLHPMLKVSSSSLVDDDEYHMILEYGKGESWAGKVAPIASRFIFSHDVSNSQMLAFEPFIQSVSHFNPDLIVISGFHLLESQEMTYWRRRIAEIADLILPLSNDVPIHVELASMANEQCITQIANQIFHLVDSIGLNEQELWLICKAGGGPHCSSHLSGPPSIPVANDIMEWMLKKYSSSPKSRLSRIHFHTLPYHVIATHTASRWRNQASSIVAGTRIACTQACDDDNIAQHPDKVNLRVQGKIRLSVSDSASREFDPSHPTMTWQKSSISFFFSPVLICKKPLKTVGLGDAISASGLLYSGFA
ncbi:ADP-dependent glucokinase [Ciona intestinalis]